MHGPQAISVYGQYLVVKLQRERDTHTRVIQSLLATKHTRLPGIALGTGPGHRPTHGQVTAMSATQLIQTQET